MATGSDDRSRGKTAGFIYILRNPEFPSLLKIGKTREPPERRARTLSTTGVPGRYTVEWSTYVEHVDRAERIAHRQLAPYRHSDGEFFSLDLNLAIQLLTHLLQPYVIGGNTRAATAAPKTPDGCRCIALSSSLRRSSCKFRRNRLTSLVSRLPSMLRSTGAMLPPTNRGGHYSINMRAFALMLTGNPHDRTRISKLLSNQTKQDLVEEIGYCQACTRPIRTRPAPKTVRRAQRSASIKTMVADLLLAHPDVRAVDSVTVLRRTSYDGAKRLRMQHLWSAHIKTKIGERFHIGPWKYCGEKHLIKLLARKRWIPAPYAFDVAKLRSDAGRREAEGRLLKTFSSQYGYPEKFLRVRILTSEDVQPKLRRLFHKYHPSWRDYPFEVDLVVPCRTEPGGVKVVDRVHVFLGSPNVHKSVVQQPSNPFPHARGLQATYLRVQGSVLDRVASLTTWFRSDEQRHARRLLKFKAGKTWSRQYYAHDFSQSHRSQTREWIGASESHKHF